MRGRTKYSERVPGCARNHNLVVKFDRTDGFAGISQWADDRPGVDRVLLSPTQFKALLVFMGKARLPTPTKEGA